MENVRNNLPYVKLNNLREKSNVIKDIKIILDS